MKLKSKCPHCQGTFPVTPAQLGLVVECPLCQGRVKISRPATNAPQQLGLRYNFECPACESQLEATDSLAGRPGRCPSCGVDLIIPSPGENATLRISVTDDPDAPDAARRDENEPEQLSAVHAFAASGLSAPQIVKLPDGRRAISCPKCSFNNALSATACGHCATPFSIDGAAMPTRSGHAAIMSMVFGLISMPLFIVGVFQALAIIMAIRALTSRRPSDRRRRYPAYVGLILGCLTALFAILHWFFK